MSEEFQDLLRAEMGQVEATPRTALVREAHQSLRQRQRAGRRAGLAVTGCVAAVAAVVTVVAAQPGATRPSMSAAASSPAKAATPVKVNLGGPGAAVQTASGAVTTKFTAETDITAATVLSEAAQASGSGNMPLVNGWPTSPYWHTLSQTTDTSCPGQVGTNNTWLGKDGTTTEGVAVSGRPNSPDQTSSCHVAPTGYYPVGGTPSGVFLGGKLYSWAQFAALPTDPARLWPILQADSTVGVAPGKGGLDWTYATVTIALSSDPMSPAMRVALYQVMEKFPGVHVAGKYTDSLGRTGVAITLSAAGFGTGTIVIDPSSGQVLAQTYPATRPDKGCVAATPAGEPGASCWESTGASTVVYISAGPANTMPLHITKFAMPPLVGDSFAQAQQTLTKDGINSASLIGAKVLPGHTAPTGTVTAQSPKAGTVVSTETMPTLTIRS